MRDPKILIVEDGISEDPGAVECLNTLKGWINRLGMSSCAGAERGKAHPDIVLLVMSTSCAPCDILPKIRSQWHSPPIIAVLPGREAVSETIKHCLVNDIDDYILGPVSQLEIETRLARALRRVGISLHTEAFAAPTLPPHFGFLIGSHPAFLQAVHKIPLFAASDAPVLIHGETGTGKELFARAIHYASPRRSYPFIPVNCSALPDHLFENELFGHARGAYTDASAPTEGLIAEAEGGTLFLDEIDTLSASGQAKVLRFVQDREYRMLGSPKSRHANIRILAATNADLTALVAKRQFRQDLYYRLNVFHLTIPALRGRLSDVPVLVRCFLRRYGNQAGRGSFELSSDALEKLLRYDWPGNVRELEGLIQRAIMLDGRTVLGPDAFDIPTSGESKWESNEPLGTAKGHVVQQFERTYLMNLMARHGGNVSRAAKAAGRPRQSLQRLLRKYHVNRAAFLPTIPPAS